MNKEKYEMIINMYNEKQINREEFDTLINELIKNLKTPLREFYKLYSYLWDSFYSVPKDMRSYLYDNALIIIESDLISNNEKNIIKCSIVNASFGDYNYDLAETYATDLINESYDDYKIYLELARYYTKTRRYGLANKLFQDALRLSSLDIVENDYEDYQKIVNKEKKEYLPATKENREIYNEFMKSLDIVVEELLNKKPEKIKREDYPTPKEHIIPDFTSFVAFDVETTGVNHNMDSITEIAAIKVVDGKIVEEKDFLFQELVHSYGRRIPSNVEKLTGITNEMVKDAREIWDVFKDFVDFIGDNILVGYNCMTFDSKFLVRAGRISNIVINNEYFDVLRLSRMFKSYHKSEKLTLVEVGKALGIENPQAHRALADAITTAKVYMKFYEITK